MRKLGFQPRCLGPEGREARVEAQRLYEDWLVARKSGVIPNRTPQPSLRKTYPQGSVGWAWERYRRTDAWKAKAPATRNKDWDWSWKWIEPVFGDVDPKSIELEDLEEFRAVILEQKGLHTAHRILKIWRAFWKVMAGFKMCQKDADPSKLIRNSAPKPRNKTWRPWEVARIAKCAWRDGYKGLAALLAVAWDTQFQPGDCRKLTLAERLSDDRGVFFDTSRGKTGKAVIGTLSRRTALILDTYLESLGVELHPDAQIFRNRSGKPYSSDTLGDDFRDLREKVFPGEDRTIMDIRRTGAVEATAGEVAPAALAAKMGNSIDHNKKLQETYLPVRTATVRLADEARRRGRRVLQENEQATKSRKAETKKSES